MSCHTKIYMLFSNLNFTKENAFYKQKCASKILRVQSSLKARFVFHQTSPTKVSLKGRLPEILQSKSTFSSDIIQIHSLFRHGFIKKMKSKFNRNRKCTYLVLM